MSGDSWCVPRLLVAALFGLALSSSPGCSRKPSEVIVPSGPLPADIESYGYYTKYLDAGGIPILAPPEVSDIALSRLKDIVNEMLGKRPALRGVLQYQEIRFAIIPQRAFTTTLPEYRDLYRLFPHIDWNTRTRGVGATDAIPTVSCGEENLLKLPDDPYVGASICMHEFAHTIHLMALRKQGPEFDEKLNHLYREARAAGITASTYMDENAGEYFAEMTQTWFNANRCINPPDGISGPICRNDILKQRDPGMWKLLDSLFPMPVRKAY